MFYSVCLAGVPFRVVRGYLDLIDKGLIVDTRDGFNAKLNKKVELEELSVESKK